LFIFHFFSFTQNISPPFGKITNQDFDISPPVADKGAEAVVVYDIGLSRFQANNDNTFEILFEKQTRLKIFTKPGIQYAEVEIHFYKRGQKAEAIYNLEAYTYNLENGTINRTKLDLSTVYEVKTGDFTYAKKFALPGVKEGSIIEYKYQKRSPFLFNLPGWDFQRQIPVLFSEYTVHTIPFYEYTWLLQGTNKLDEYKTFREDGPEYYYGGVTYNDMVSIYRMKNVPSFKDEPFITTSEDYLIKLNFQLSKVINTRGTQAEVIDTWDKLAKELTDEKEFGKYMNAAESQSKDILIANQVLEKTVQEKFEFVVKYMKDNYTWNEENRKYADKPVKDFMKEKSGNSAEINLFLAGMLNAAGIESYPVLVSTRDHGKVYTDYPFLHFFNYVIVLAKVNEKWIMADATEPFCAPDKIPVKCLNGKGLVVREKKAEWLELGQKTSSVKQSDVVIRLNPSCDTINAELKITTTGYEAVQLKKNEGKKQDVLKAYFARKGLEPVGNIEVQNFDEPKKPYILQCSVQMPAEILENKILLSPLHTEQFSTNPFPAAERKYPVDLIYPMMRIFNSVIYIPEGYKVTKYPDRLFIDNALLFINYDIKQEENKLLLQAAITFKKSIYPAEEYIKLRFHFIDISHKFNEKVILEKE
jgi:hypothetical protein